MFTLSATILGSTVLWLAIFSLWIMGIPLSSRLLAPVPVAIFLLGYALLQITNCQVAYLRAHGKEAFLVGGVLSSLLAGVCVYSFGSKFGPIGAAASFTAVIALFTLPFSSFVFIRRRNEWQGQSG